MSEWSVSVTNAVPADAGDLDDAVGRVLDAVHAHSPAASYSHRRVTVRIAVRADEVRAAAQSGVEVVASALSSIGWLLDVLDLRVTEWTLFESALEEPTYPEIVGISEIAALVGTSRQRASELARSRTFPAPLAELAAGPVWPKAAVERFVEEWERKPGRPRSTAAAT